MRSQGLRPVRGLAAGVAILLGLAAFTGCGSDSDPEPSGSTDGTTVTSAATTGASPAATSSGGTSSGGTTSGAASGDCPISVEALATATSLSWRLREHRENHPQEVDESIIADVCVFTADDTVDSFGDPLVFRTDVVTGADAVTVRQRFTGTCTDFGGSVEPAGGGSVCRRNGIVVEGIKGEGDRVVEASFVNADTSTATTLTPVFERIVAALR